MAVDTPHLKQRLRRLAYTIQTKWVRFDCLSAEELAIVVIPGSGYSNGSEFESQRAGDAQLKIPDADKDSVKALLSLTQSQLSGSPIQS